ncbi:chondroitin sulfate synthase 1-like [Cimex lectularius]|uniref:Hexosyltransferase n=1 Tax=Cimex lectularius TaxID=79782 RepID=A0A8I6SPT6_CIMLE|nr:chondroitin sulfate synthase 1-like [Cimex lectularius]
MQTIMYHNSSGSEAYSGNLKRKEIHRAISLHPVKKYKNLYRIDNYMTQLLIQDRKFDIVKIEREILRTESLIRQTNFPRKIFNQSELEKSQILGQPPGLSKSVIRSEAEIIHWEFIQRSQFSALSANPRRKIDASLKEGLDDVIREVMEIINMYSKERGRVIDFKELLYGYHRMNPVFGSDYILDMLLVFKKYRGRKMTVPVRRHAYLQQQFTGDAEMAFREVYEGEEVPPGQEREGTKRNPSGIKETFEMGLMKISENLPSIIFPSAEGDSKRINDKLINFILPLSGRFEVFRRFISNFEDVCLKNNENVALIVVLFPSDKENTVQNVLDSIKSLQNKYSYARIVAVPVFDNFSRANALSIGASQVSEPRDLLFFIDVDIVFKSECLRRIRTNTVRGKSVYFPIVYSEYDPEIVYNKKISPSHFNFTDVTGYWRQYGFGIGSVYKSDLLKVGGFNTDIKGWGKEDVDLFDKFIATAANTTIFRSVDLGMVHVFHVVDCDLTLEAQQLKMCKATRADTYGSVKQLSEYYNNNRLKIDTIFHLTAS